MSLHSALAYYGLIPEYVPIVTSITTTRPMTFTTTEGTFSYRHMKKSMFRGYRAIVELNNQSVFIAMPEKSLLDLIYLTPGGDRLDYLYELRLQNTENHNEDKKLELAAESGSRKLKVAVQRIVKIVQEQRELMKS